MSERVKLNEIPNLKVTLQKTCSSPRPVCLSTSLNLQVDTFDFATIFDPQANIMASGNRDEELRVPLYKRITRMLLN